jgi:hypothetical protein
VNNGALTALFDGLLDDAVMFPPTDAPLREAVAAHAIHRMSWYGGLVASFVCAAGRLPSLGERLAAHHLPRLAVSLVVPGGLDAIPSAVAAADRTPGVDLVAVEVARGHVSTHTALKELAHCAGSVPAVYLELPVVGLTEDDVHAVAASGVRVKLRTGGTTLHAFHTEEQLARAILLCAAERQAFKCTAGLHHAVRHRDESTMFEHHGFLNIALAARVAAATGNVATTRDVLAERDPAAIAGQVRDLGASDIRAVRALFGSFGTCSITDPVDDLVALGLLP